MNIESIEIKNIKGIEEKKFNLNLVPNKPNILVAPNGFGKSSFAIAFNSLRTNKIELNEKNYYLKNENNEPYLSIKLSNGICLIADKNQNTISDTFDVFVINNQTEPKAKVQTFSGHSFAKPSLDIMPTILIKTIPPKITFDYSSSLFKSNFGKNGGKIFSNITSLFKNSQFIHRLISEIDFTRFDLKNNKAIIENSLAEMNTYEGKGNEIKKLIETNILPKIIAIDELNKLAKIIEEFNFSQLQNQVDYYLAAIQIKMVKEKMGIDFNKACKYLFYLDKKEFYTQTLAHFNPVKNRFNIQPKEEDNSLVVKWPKAHEISNGQRDILTFCALLLKSKRDLKKRDCILIIDEIFDYMDDANLITFQYYISTFIDEMKNQKRRIFPILLTHLDPLFFNHFCFNDNKIKVSYLKEINIKSNKNLLNIIYKREDPKIQNSLDSYYFHFHPDITNIDLKSEFKELNLNIDWATPDSFFKRIFREIRRYLYETTAFDPISICFGLRIQIEKLLYDKISGVDNKNKFLEIHGTKNKLNFAHSLGIQIPETYFLLGIIYNTSLHLTDGQDISQPLGIKLENETIKQMIYMIFH
ncbi:hypothetical protein [Chryseobacterium mucoviscidosis]|uniref:hypothetical protein n=1 Tax=Chryseobacterium mucoviscidosis TaxID=1945581 RepID=UPI0031D4543A